MIFNGQLRTVFARMVIARSRPAETIMIGGMPMEIRQCDSLPEGVIMMAHWDKPEGAIFCVNVECPK